MAEPRARSSRLGRAALALGGALAALLIGELALRALGVAPDRFRAPRSLESGDKRAAIDLYPDDPRDAFPLDLRHDVEARDRWQAQIPEVAEHWQQLPHGVPLRFAGPLCRGGAIEDAAPRSRVVVMGDSFTEGQGVLEAHTFSARLDDALPGAQVLNCGRRGLDFPSLRERFDTLAALSPDVVVYAMVLNDPERSEAFHARQRFIDDWILDRRRMVSEGDGGPPSWPPWIWQLAADRIESWQVGSETTAWYQAMVGEHNAEGWARTVDDITEMSEAMGGRFVVALWPLLVSLDGDYPFEATHRVIGEALRARGVRFVDARPWFAGHDASALWVHAADRHPNDDAHAIFARGLEPTLAELLADAEGSP